MVDVGSARAAEKRPVAERVGPFVVLASAETALVLAGRDVVMDEWRRAALLANVAAALLLVATPLLRRAHAHSELPTDLPAAQLLRFAAALGFGTLVVGTLVLLDAFDQTGFERWLALIGGPFLLFVGTIFTTAFFAILGERRGAR